MKYIIGYCLVFFILITKASFGISSSLTWLLCYIIAITFIWKSDPLSPEPWLFFSWNVLFINLFSGIRYTPSNVDFLPPVAYALIFLFCFHLGYRLNKKKVDKNNIKRFEYLISLKSNRKMQYIYTIAGICSIIGVVLVLFDIFFMLGLSMDGGERRAGFIENFSNLSWRTNIGMVLAGGIYVSMFSIFWGGNKKNSIIGVLSFFSSILYSFAIGGKQGVLLSLLVVSFALFVRKKYNVKSAISIYAKFGSVCVLFFVFSYITLLSSERHENAGTGDLLNDTEHFSKEFIAESNKYLPNSIKNTFAEFFGYYCDQLGTFSEQWNIENYPEKYEGINIVSDPISPFVFIDRQVKKIFPYYCKIFPDEEDLIKRIANQKKGYYGLANWQTIIVQGLRLYGIVGLLIVFFMHGFFSKTLVVSTKNNFSYSKMGLCFINAAFMVYTIMCNILGETSILIYLIFLLYCLYREVKRKNIFPF